MIRKFIFYQETQLQVLRRKKLPNQIFALPTFISEGFEMLEFNFQLKHIFLCYSFLLT